MPKKACCCKPKTFCCNSTFYKDFITLYGTSMAEHAEVSPDDWVALYVPRIGSNRSEYRRIWPNANGVCNCCCNCPNFDNADTTNPNNQGGQISPNTGNNTTTVGNGASPFRFNNTTSTGAKLPGGTIFGGVRGSHNNDDFFPPCDSDGEAWRAGVRNLDDPRHLKCKRACCTGDIYTSYMPSSNPIIFAYKYSGCNLTWFPRELSFDHDPYVSQCNGFLGYRIRDWEEGGGYQLQPNTCNPQGFRAALLGSTPNTFVEACMSPDPVDKAKHTPCACMPFPHIHGGVYDSVYNRVNVKLTPYQLGYVSYMEPFTQDMLSEEAGCCWCAGTGDPAASSTYFVAKEKAFRSGYPRFDQLGKTATPYGGAIPGVNCHYTPYGNNCPLPDCSGFNPNYTSNCYAWGISPYLLRISKTKYKMAYGIWSHGRFAGYSHDFGPVYQGSYVKINNESKDIEVKFKKVQRRNGTHR